MKKTVLVLFVQMICSMAFAQSQPQAFFNHPEISQLKVQAATNQFEQSLFPRHSSCSIQASSCESTSGKGAYLQPCSIYCEDSVAVCLNGVIRDCELISQNQCYCN